MTQELLPPNKPDRVRSFALSGMAGVGKSQTALEFVHKNLDRFKAVLWVSADGRQKLAQGFVEIARALGIFDIAVAEDQAKSIASVKRWCMTTGSPKDREYGEAAGRETYADGKMGGRAGEREHAWVVG